MAHLYAVLEEAHLGRVELLDLDLEFSAGDRGVDYYVERGVRLVEGTDPDVVCISCKAAQFPYAALFARRYKELHPEVKIIMGGWMPTLAPELTLRLSGCDAAVRGEGERALPELIRRIGEGPLSVRGVSYIEGGRIAHNPNSEPLTGEELDRLPQPRYDVLPPPGRYQLRRGGFSFSVEASRGCTNRRCIFCWNSTRNCDTSWRAKSPGRVVREIRRLVDDWGARIVFFTDDSFGADPEWLRGFTRLMAEEFRPGEVVYISSMRVDTVRGTPLRELHRSGLRSVFHGVESGSPRMWSLLGKGFGQEVTPQYIIRLAEEELSAGIVPTFSFMIGLPHEEEEDLEATVSLCRQLASVGSLFAFHILAPYEGTALAEAFPGLIEQRDIYREFGESESFLPEFYRVFGDRVREFAEALPDFRWVRPTVPLHVFAEKYRALDRIVSSGEGSPYRQYNLEAASRSQAPGEGRSLLRSLRRVLRLRA